MFSIIISMYKYILNRYYTIKKSRNFIGQVRLLYIYIYYLLTYYDKICVTDDMKKNVNK